MHSHHSHSGQFSQHAKDTLEEMVQRAIEMGFTRYCLTEHVPRLVQDHLYPEEIESKTTPKDLEITFDKYYTEAQRLREKYKDQIQLLIGFEAEGINPAYLQFMKEIQKKYKFDMFVGSLHHVDEIPIDFSQELWLTASKEAGGVEELYSRYFDQQYAMIEALKPPVVGHFDLIRLYSPEFDLENSAVWPKVVRNVQLAASLGCLFEVNTAALRKGWSTPYPQTDIVQVIREHQGKFCLSDDAHGVAQVGLNYDKAMPYLQALGGPLRSIDGSELKWDDLDVWVKRNSIMKRTQL